MWRVKVWDNRSGFLVYKCLFRKPEWKSEAYETARLWRLRGYEVYLLKLETEGDIQLDF